MSYTTPEHILLGMCEKFNTPRSLAVSMLLKAGEFQQLLSLNTDPLGYLQEDITKFRDDYLVTEYLSKYEGHEAGIDTERVALDGFATNEAQCEAANIRIQKLFSGNENPSKWLPVIRRAQKLILKAIGEKPDLKLFSRYCKWGSGSTYSIRGYQVRVDNKVREDKISITKSAIRYFQYAVGDDLAFLNARRIPAEGPCSLMRREFNIVHGGKGMTVPKNAKTDRFICNEPSGNIFLQLGAGKLLRLALKRVGVDLNDQSINQVLALIAVKLGLATVDLKAASDTICEALVDLLLPEAWSVFLDALRSPYIEVDNQWYLAEKFSAMGNGFTFELESLIFWSLTTALRDSLGVKGRISVYGDDIICPSEIVPQLQELFSVVGFNFNEKKTHYASGFRESCGKHYFWGFDVTPFYQKEKPDTTLNDPRVEGEEPYETYEKFYRMRNRVLYHALDRGSVAGDYAIADKAFRKIIQAIKVPEGPSVPIESARRILDSGIVKCARQLKLKWHGWSYSLKALSFKAYDERGHVGALYSVYMRTRAQTQGELNKYLLPEVRRRLPFKYLAKEHALRPMTIESEPFDGTVSLRDDGIWSLGRKYYDKPLMLLWA